jgi:hypothetical protein
MESCLAKKSTKARWSQSHSKIGHDIICSLSAAADSPQRPWFRTTMIEGRADICASDNMGVILVFCQLRMTDSEDNHCLFWKHVSPINITRCHVLLKIRAGYVHNADG